MVREALSQWDYVIAAYAIAIPAIAGLRMRRAERARDEARQKGRKG